MEYRNVDIFDRLRTLKNANKSLVVSTNLYKRLNSFCFTSFNNNTHVYFFYQNLKFKLTSSLKVKEIRSNKESKTVIAQILETKIQETYDILCNK